MGPKHYTSSNIRSLGGGDPQVSVGLPVRNGESFLEAAIESHLAQTFEDFELVISDNASNDRTPEICSDYASSDRRISYSRVERDHGAAANFNRVVELTSGRYFRWAASDDLVEREFLARCIEALDADPQVILAMTKVRILDDVQQTYSDYGFRLNASSVSPSRRMKHLIVGHECFEIFGLIRKESLTKTPLMGDYFGADAVLINRLGLIGRFCEIPEYLFISRAHAGQSKSKFRTRPLLYSQWFQNGSSQRWNMPYWRVGFEYLSTVRSSDLDVLQKALCYSHIAKWWIRRSRFCLRDLLRIMMIALRYRPSPRDRRVLPGH